MSIVSPAAKSRKDQESPAKAPTYPLVSDIHHCGAPKITSEFWRAAHRNPELAPKSDDNATTAVQKAHLRWTHAKALTESLAEAEHGVNAEHLQVAEHVACRSCDKPLPDLRRQALEARETLANWYRRRQDIQQRLLAADTQSELEQCEELESDLLDEDLTAARRSIAQAREPHCERCAALVNQMAHRTDTELRIAALESLRQIGRQAERWRGHEPVNFLKPWTAPPFEADDVPSALSRYAALFADQTGIDASITLTAGVGTAAAAIDDHIQICGDRASDWFESARLWTLAVGLPSAGKTPGMKRMLVPLEQIEQELINTYNAQLDIWEGADPQARGDKPGRPCVITSNPTIEAQANILVANERGILLKAEEFTTYVGAMDRYNKDGGDRAYQLSAFDGGPLNMERATEGKSRYVRNWGVSLLASTTPAEIERMSSKLGHLDGLMQRIIAVLARPRVYIEEANKPAEDRVRGARDEYHALIRKLWRLTPPAEGAFVELSKEAHEAFAAWRKELLLLIEGYENREPALAAHLGKYEALLLRVALTFHAIECVTGGGTIHPVARPVSGSTFALAIRYMRRVEQHATVFYLNSSSSDQVQLAKDVGWYIIARKAEEQVLERRELVMNVRRFKNSDDKLREAAMGLLTDYGWVLASEEGGYRKELPTRWDLNPVLADAFATEKENESKRRELVRERIAESSRERKLKKRNDQG